MSAAIAGEQGIATFALHALWQAPLLAGAAWCAVRMGRPSARVAYAAWVCTLLACVALPVVSSVAAQHAAVAAERASQTSISYESGPFLDLPPMQREPAWLRLLHRHVNARDGVQPFALALPQRAARVIASGWLLLSAFFFLKLCAGYVRVRRLVRGASNDALPPAIAAALHRQCEQLQRPRADAKLHDGIAGPVLAGVLRPVLLLPSRAAAEMGRAEIEAVLAHELAHLRRRDPVVHAVCSLLLLPVGFHPAALWAARCVRQTREIACDAEAAERLGSATGYARALLHVAERAGNGRVATNFFSNGLFGAGLQLFTHRGAMEERMQMLMSNESKVRNRSLRVAAGLSLATVAVAAAAMLQVQPTLAAERGVPQAATATSPQAAPAQDDGPALIGGEHAREQLRRAHRELQQAEAKASTSEERRKIEGAQQAVSVAEQALAAADASSSSRNEPDLRALDHLDVQLKDLKIPDMAALQLQMKNFKVPDMAAIQVQMDKQEQALAKLDAKMNSPEWKAQMEATKRAMETARAQMNSPEFRAQMDTARKIDQAKLNEIMAHARAEQEKAMEQFRSGALQRQLEAAQLMARLEPPSAPTAPPAFDAQGDKPLPVPSSAMQGNKIGGDNPVYPAEAKEKHIMGTVVLHAIIDKSGKVESVQVASSPDAQLSKSAVTAVQTWTYKPYLLNGNPMAVDTTININFSLAQ